MTKENISFSLYRKGDPIPQETKDGVDVLYNQNYKPELGFDAAVWCPLAEEDYDALVVAQDKFGPVGFLRILHDEDKDSELLASSAVHPDFRKKGIWGQMINRAEKYATKRKTTYLEAVPAGPVSTKLETALEKKGFKPVGSLFRKKITHH